MQQRGTGRSRTLDLCGFFHLQAYSHCLKGNCSNFTHQSVVPGLQHRLFISGKCCMRSFVAPEGAAQK